MQGDTLPYENVTVYQVLYVVWAKPFEVQARLRLQAAEETGLFSTTVTKIRANIATGDVLYEENTSP